VASSFFASRPKARVFFPHHLSMLSDVLKDCKEKMVPQAGNTVNKTNHKSIVQIIS
jgi:hypothetical protein